MASLRRYVCYPSMDELPQLEPSEPPRTCGIVATLSLAQRVRLLDTAETNVVEEPELTET